MSPPPVLTCRGLAKTFGTGAGRVAALRGVDLDVAAGEVVVLMGPSGCGKTTLLAIIAGFTDPDSGSAMIDGVDIAALSRSAATVRRAGSLGFVFQSFNLLPALTACANASVPLLLAGLSRREAERRAADALSRVGLADRLGHLPSQLSGGQQQRVAIARAIVNQPRLILCDEPTSALDHATGQQIMAQLIERARSLKSGLVVVTHDPRIASFADRLIAMNDGRIVAPEMAAA